METKKRNLWLSLLMILSLALFFILIFYADNKYMNPPPYGKNGVITLTEDDLSRKRPLFLIDGWLLSDASATDLPTYIGEFSTLQRGNKMISPHGKARYEMTLRYSGSPLETAINFPQLFSDHIITLDGKILSQSRGNARFFFTLTPGDHLLTVETSSSQGYYSGMYHPPAIGQAETVYRLVLTQCIAYGLAFFSALTLALFTLVLWRSTKDAVAFWFGLLCCCFSLYISYYFVRLLEFSADSYWYLIQSLALYGLCFCTIRLTILSGSITKDRDSLLIQKAVGAASALLFTLALLIPVISWAVWLHGILTDAYFVFTCFAMLFVIFKSRKKPGWEYQFTQLACAAFGTGLLYNLFASNLFEPIMFFWQFEWCGLLLVILFGSMMAARNKRILKENLAFQNHLEDMVAQRTEELSNLLRERKIFFADMAHDLKAPVFAAGSFIQAIKDHNTGVDAELLRYIDLVEQKQQEMTRRIQGLTEFNKIDLLAESYESISLKKLLEETYRSHHMAAEVQSIHLTIELPETDGYIYAQPGKLAILLENLIFNAIHATPREGQITLSAELDEDGCHLSVADTGTGILPEDLPHLFERFYVGRQNKHTGSGLGLYIVKSIVDSMHGEISVSSKPDQGSIFYIDFPLQKE